VFLLHIVDLRVESLQPEKVPHVLELLAVGAIEVARDTARLNDVGQLNPLGLDGLTLEVNDPVLVDRGEQNNRDCDQCGGKNHIFHRGLLGNNLRSTH
jgi:hypothetical protein